MMVPFIYLLLPVVLFSNIFYRMSLLFRCKDEVDITTNNARGGIGDSSRRDSSRGFTRGSFRCFMGQSQGNKSLPS